MHDKRQMHDNRQLFEVGGGVNMPEAQIYMEQHKKHRTITLTWGGVVFQLGNL